MTNLSHRTLARLAPLAAAAALAATACGSSTPTSQPEAELPEVAVPADKAALDIAAPAATSADTTETVVTTSPTPDPAPVPAPAPDPDPAPSPQGPSDVAAPGTPPCGAVSPIPGDATIVSNLALDVVADGTADDQIVTYLHAGWMIRATVDGVTSEVGVSGVGPGSVRVLGTANVGSLTAGNEMIATVGAGAYATQIGIYGIDVAGCIFAFEGAGGTEFVMSAGASASNGSRFLCGPDYVAGQSWGLDPDGTYSIGSAAHEESTLGEFSYLPASDDYNEGLTDDELPADIFDCNGLSL